MRREALHLGCFPSLRRIQGFLNLPTFDTAAAPCKHASLVPQGAAIRVAGCDFRWQGKGDGSGSSSEGDDDGDKAGGDKGDTKKTSHRSSVTDGTSVATREASDSDDSDSDGSDGGDKQSDVPVQRGSLFGIDLTVRYRSYTLPATAAMYVTVVCCAAHQIKRGALVVVVGSVGSGKSSLLSAILGEMPPTSPGEEPRVGVRGTVGYVPQRAFIMSASLRRNIVMNRRWDAKRYARVIDGWYTHSSASHTLCCLKCGNLTSSGAVVSSCLGPDILTLPGGDATQLGAAGTTLSGGQAARVSLARCVRVYCLVANTLLTDLHVVHTQGCV